MSLEVSVSARRAAHPRRHSWSPIRALWLDLAWIAQHVTALRRHLAVHDWQAARTQSDAVHALVACHVEWEVDLLSRLSLASTAAGAHDRLLDAVRDLSRSLAVVPPGREAAPGAALGRLGAALDGYAEFVERELYPIVESDSGLRRQRGALAATWRRTMARAYVAMPI